MTKLIPTKISEALPDGFTPQYWDRSTHGNRIFFHDAFISYANRESADQLTAKLADDLSNRGVRVWHDASSCMHDAQWSMRICQALRQSRFVVLTIHSDQSPLIKPWVRLEVESAINAEKETSEQRLIIANFCNAPIPSEFDKQRSFCPEMEIDALADFVKSGNLLPSSLKWPPEPRACHEMLNSWEYRKMTSTRTSWWDSVWFWTGASLKQVVDDSDHEAPNYELWISSQKEAIQECSWPVEIRKMVVEGLESLATFTGREEGRANAALCLLAISRGGAREAGDALLRILRREGWSSLARMLFEKFSTSRSNLPLLEPPDWARALIQGINDAPLSGIKALLPADCGSLVLYRFVQMRTIDTVKQLNQCARSGEIDARFEVILNCQDMLRLELLLRDLIDRGGFGYGCITRTEKSVKHPLSELIRVTLKIVETFGKKYPERLWILPFETVLLLPLATASLTELEPSESWQAANRFLDVIESAVIRDLAIVNALVLGDDNPADETLRDLLLRQLCLRKKAVEMYRSGPSTSEKLDTIHVFPYQRDSHAAFQCASDQFYAHEHRLKGISQSIPIGPEFAKDETLLQMWNRWWSLPTC